MDTTYPVVISVDGNTYNFTGESLAEYIKHAEARKDAVGSLQNELSSAFRSIASMRSSVFHFFNERHTTGDTEMEFEVSDINELLDEIGADKLRNLYSATVIITVEVSGIEATDEDDAKQAIEDELVVEVGMFDVRIEQTDIDDVREE